MTDAMLDMPVKPPTFHAISASRKIKNRVAEGLFASAFIIAMVPLVWLLYTVISRGYQAVISSTWWNRSLAGVLPEEFAGGVYHAIYGTIIQATVRRVAPTATRTAISRVRAVTEYASTPYTPMQARRTVSAAANVARPAVKRSWSSAPSTNSDDVMNARSDRWPSDLITRV